MNALAIGVLAGGDGESRVPLVPEGVRRLLKSGLSVVVQAGAGVSAFQPDAAYTEAGATVAPRRQVVEQSTVLLTINGPAAGDALRPGQVVVGLLGGSGPDLNDRGVATVALEAMPRTLSRCQAMDVLTSQAGVAGYKAALMAATAYGRYLPMLITAAGTSRPARVLVLGAGVAGLSAVGTARRLGAVVTGYDVRPETRAEIESLGARFLDLAGVGPASGTGGYARALTPEEQRVQQSELETHLADFDIVITTAAVPGRRPPLLVPATALERMRPGSVVVDMASGPLGGNVEGSVPGVTSATPGGVSVIGAANLATTVPAAASEAFSANMTAVVGLIVRDGELALDPDDEVRAAIVTRPGEEPRERIAAV